MTKTERLFVRVSPELKEALADRAKAEDRTISMVIHRALQAYLNQKQER